MESLSPILIAFIVGTYLLGSFSSAITLSKIMGFADPRSEGSQNPGATNVLRIAGKKAAALTLFGDLLKGLAPVLVANLFFADGLALALIGFSAFIGHCFPVYYSFDGGKGVATAIGFILAFNWIIGLAIVGIWLIVAKVFRFSSLAALIAFSLLPIIYYLLYGNPEVSIVLILLTLIMTYRHKTNIQRLIRGNEQTSSLKNDQSQP